MATSLARRAAILTRLSISSSSSASLIPRRGLAGAADHHGPPKVHVWEDLKHPGNWKEEEFVIVSMTGWGLFIYGAYKFFTGGKKNEGEKLVEAAK